MALPKHEIAEPLDAARADKEVEGRRAGGEHVGGQGGGRDGFRVGVDGAGRAGVGGFGRGDGAVGVVGFGFEGVGVRGWVLGRVGVGVRVVGVEGRGGGGGVVGVGCRAGRGAGAILAWWDGDASGGGGKLAGADGVDDVRLGERALRRGERFRVLDDRLPDRRRDLVLRGVREADVQDGLAVAARQLDGFVDGLEHVGLDELALSEDPDAGAVSLQQVAVLRQLGELDFRHVHERIDFVLGSLEILDAEGVDGYHSDAGFVAHFQYLSIRSTSALCETLHSGVLQGFRQSLPLLKLQTPDCVPLQSLFGGFSQTFGCRP